MKHIRQFFIWSVERIELIKRRFVNPEVYIKSVYLKRMGSELHLDSPVTFSEKIQWLKLYWHRPILTQLVDKYEVKHYVSEVIGGDHIIPTIGVWEKVIDIDWEGLPNQFVLKTTHNSGGVIICTDKTAFDKKKAIQRLRRELHSNYYFYGFEWPYKDVKPRVIAEEYVVDSETQELRDYKFFCFNGEVKALFVATERQLEGVDVKFDWFDADYNHLSIKQGHENATTPPQKPLHFEEMKTIAMRLSKGFPHVRVDLYEANGRVYFGELTFFHHGGWTRFEPEKWDYIFGEWLTLPDHKDGF